MKRLRLLSLLGVLFLVGCGGAPNELTGKVSRKSRPLDNGYITFFPVRADGNAYGAPIVNGAFEVKDMPAGKRRVLITVHPHVTTVGGKAKLAPVEPIAPNAVGNNVVVDVSNGKHSLSFDL